MNSIRYRTLFPLSANPHLSIAANCSWWWNPREQRPRNHLERLAVSAHSDQCDITMFTMPVVFFTLVGGVAVEFARPRLEPVQPYRDHIYIGHAVMSSTCSLFSE